MIIEVFYFAGCPSYPPTVERIRNLIREENLAGQVRSIEVPNFETARRWRFLGSPTVRVNGIDIEPSAITDVRDGVCCRTYGTVGVPSVDLIRRALRTAAGVPIELHDRE
jgi:hypothetical protein